MLVASTRKYLRGLVR